MGRYVCVNGSLIEAGAASVDVLDRGFLYGYGLFETVRVEGGQPLLLDEHLERLARGARELEMVLPSDTGGMARMVYDTISFNGIVRGALRLTLTAGPEVGEGLGVLVITAQHGLRYRAELYGTGIVAGFLDTPRNERSPLVKLKSLNYLENYLGRREARRRGWDEGLFINTAGYLAEGTVSNVFLVVRGRLVTPDVDSGILPGVTRRLVLEEARSRGLEVMERPVRPEELLDAEESFVTNALMGVMPLVSVGGRPVGRGKPGPVTELLMDAVKDHGYEIA